MDSFSNKAIKIQDGWINREMMEQNRMSLKKIILKEVAPVLVSTDIFMLYWSDSAHPKPHGAGCMMGVNLSSKF